MANYVLYWKNTRLCHVLKLIRIEQHLFYHNSFAKWLSATVNYTHFSKKLVKTETNAFQAEHTIFFENLQSLTFCEKPLTH